jgi:hypothetical protein
MALPFENVVTSLLWKGLIFRESRPHDQVVVLSCIEHICLPVSISLLPASAGVCDQTLMTTLGCRCLLSRSEPLQTFSLGDKHRFCRILFGQARGHQRHRQRGLVQMVWARRSAAILVNIGAEGAADCGSGRSFERAPSGQARVCLALPDELLPERPNFSPALQSLERKVRSTRESLHPPSPRPSWIR